MSNLQLLINSSIVGFFASAITVSFAVALALSYKQSNILKPSILISTSGYAIPGSVISAGLLVGIDFIFDTSITFYGILGLLMCLALRFMTPAFNYISASLSNISESAENSLQTQPKNSLKAFKFFYFPQMKPAIFLSLMLVFIESIKEQPATLLLRPVGFDTLCKRRGMNSWQFPQGGIDKNEDPLKAAKRELFEEVGINSKYVKLIKSSDEWYKYDVPEKSRRKILINKKFKGQKQKWFLFKLKEN